MKRFVITSIALLLCCLASAQDYGKYYTDLPFELTPPVAPAIPDVSVSLPDFGGVPDGITLCTEAFAKAISALAKQGGGHLIVPPGIWLTGPIILKDHIDLHLEKGAMVLMSPDR